MLLCLSSCDTSIEPYASSNRYFSVQGYLYAEVDTNWIRVEALQDGLPVGSGPVDVAEAYLENLTTGTVLAMDDSLFLLPPGGIPAHNFRSVLPVAAGQSYRLTIRRSDGAATTAVTTLPEAIPDPELIDTPVIPVPCPDDYMPPALNVVIRDIDYLVELVAVYHLQEPEGVQTQRISYLEEAVKTEDGYMVRVVWEDAVGACPLNFEAMELLIVAGNTDWPDVSEPNSENRAIPERPTNIVNGIGFLGGAIGKTVSVPVFYLYLDAEP